LWPDRIQLPQFIGLFVSIDLNPFGELAPRGGQALVRATVDSAQPLFASAGRRAPTDSDGAETTRILFAWAKAAAHACDLAAELRRRAQKLAEAAPKLRAKGAKAALQALLAEDSLAAATPIAGLSERGTRRLFERLGALGAIRELTGRATFRLYGL
jgi:Fic family protein